MVLSAWYQNKKVTKSSLIAKVWVIMKLTIILLIFFTFQVTAKSVAQRVTIEKNNIRLSEVFNEIEQQTGVHFFYDKDLIQKTEPIDISVKDVSLQEALFTSLKGQQLTYTIVKNTVVIQKAQDLSRESEVKIPVELPPPVQIHGRVVDQKGNPIQNASVLIAGTKIGTTTNNDGYFELTADNNKNITLQFSSIGFQTKSIKIGKETQINVTLEQNVAGLNDVVVVGYGTQKKIDLTGAVDVVSGTELQNRSAPNVSQLMQGLSPNLNIAMSTSGGEPGSTMSWTLRGIGSLSSSATPLILIDGVQSNVDDLNPDDIESISVLKDAAASAIYGSRAPFGVVLITTKKGQKGAVRISYNNNFSWASPIRYPLDDNSITWASAANVAYANSGLSPAYPAAQLERMKNYIAGTYLPEYDTLNPPTSLFASRSLGNANYDWTNMLFRKNSLSQKHDINVSGGDDKTQYYISSGYYDQGGLYNWGNDSYKRYNILANLNSKANNWLSFNFGTKYAQTLTDYPLGEVGTDRSYNFTSIFQFGPMTPLYNVDGTINNPIVSSMKYSGRNKTVNNDLWVRLGTTIEPIKGWKTNITYNYNVGFSTNDQNPLPIPTELPNGKLGNAGFANSGAVESKENWNYYIFDALTSYEKSIGHHYFKVMGGYEEEASKSSNLNGSRMNLISVDVPSINAANGAIALGANASNWSTQAVFGRVNYNYDEKYLLEFSGRYNGSSRFAPDSRWGFFPSVSAGYVISKEDFWSSIKRYVNTLKLRGSYGSLGNQNVGNYLYLSTIPVSNNSGQTYPQSFIINGQLPTYAQVPGIISNSLTWETATTSDVGVDADMLSNRLNLSFDWYKRITSNMFGPATPLPAVLGTSAPEENNAKLETTGYEVSVSWNDKITQNLGYNVKVSLGDNQTTILKYNGGTENVYAWHDGKKLGEIWGYVSDGLIQTAGEKMADQSYIYQTWGPGDMKYKDLNNDGVINDGTQQINDHGDLKVIGNSLPRYNFGVSVGITWKRFAINSFWQGVLKRDYLPGPGASAYYGFGQSGFKQSEFYRNGTMLNFWRPSNDTTIFGPNTNAFFPKPYATTETLKNIQPQTQFVLNAAYARLKTLQIQYTFPPNILKSVFIESLRIYATGENLITITKLPKQIDPETIFVSDNSSSYYTGNQGATFIYPVAKRYSIGINLTF